MQFHSFLASRMGLNCSYFGWKKYTKLCFYIFNSYLCYFWFWQCCTIYFFFLSIPLLSVAIRANRSLGHCPVTPTSQSCRRPPQTSSHIQCEPLQLWQWLDAPNLEIFGKGNRVPNRLSTHWFLFSLKLIDNVQTLQAGNEVISLFANHSQYTLQLGATTIIRRIGTTQSALQLFNNCKY